MLWQTTPPDTSAYMIAGYVVIFGGLFLYLLSLNMRRRRFEQELRDLEEIIPKS